MINEHEQAELSALMDGELDRFTAKRVLDRTLKDPQSIERWKRYHLISDALQQGLNGHGGDELRERVREALQEEPAISGSQAGWFKAAAGFAIAASVAVVAVLGVRSVDDGAEVAGTPLIASTPARPAVVERIDLNAIARVKKEPAAADQQRLNRYLVEHAERASGSINGALSYARIVSYGVSH